MRMPDNAGVESTVGQPGRGEGELSMGGREELLQEVGELAAHYEMTYFG